MSQLPRSTAKDKLPQIPRPKAHPFSDESPGAARADSSKNPVTCIGGSPAELAREKSGT
jgi:hypothetical protein